VGDSQAEPDHATEIADRGRDMSAAALYDFATQVNPDTWNVPQGGMLKIRHRADPARFQRRWPWGHPAQMSRKNGSAY
jgi:hypothetical protein